MTRHSKNNAARSFFTSAEKGKLSNVYGTLSQRLGSDSMRAFDSCYLCLHSARLPMVCGQGHLCCKECAIAHILTQKKAAEDKVRHRQAQLVAAEAEGLKDEEVKKRKEIERFERGEKLIKLDSHAECNTVGAVSSIKSPRDEGEESSVKVKSSFWIPGQQPEAKESVIEAPSKEVYCTAITTPHPISMKKLYPVQFTLDTSAKGNSPPPTICPCCSKALTNGSKIAIIRICGHAICTPCGKQFASKSCPVCEVGCKAKDLIALYSDGTGFSGSGGSLVLAKKETVAFQ